MAPSPLPHPHIFPKEEEHLTSSPWVSTESSLPPQRNFPWACPRRKLEHWTQQQWLCPLLSHSPLGITQDDSAVEKVERLSCEHRGFTDYATVPVK